MGKTYNTSSSTDAIQNPVHCQMSQYWDRGQIKASEQKNHVTYTDQELERLWISRQSWKLEDNGLTTPSNLCGKIISNLLSQTQPNDCSTVGVNILTKSQNPCIIHPFARALRRGTQGPPARLDSRGKEKKAVRVLKEGRSQTVTEHQAGGVTGRRGRDQRPRGRWLRQEADAAAHNKGGFRWPQWILDLNYNAYI